MNNKGMTLVELLVTFSLLMVIVIGMFNLILDTRLDLDNKQIAGDYTEYSNFINSDITQDLITRRPVAVAVKSSESSNWACSYSDMYLANSNCKISDNTFKVDAQLTDLISDEYNSKVSGSVDLQNICSNMYPCAVYAYFNQDDIATDTITPQFAVIAINAPKILQSGGAYGIKYGNKDKAVFEEIPDPKYLDVKRIVYSSIDITNFKYEDKDKNKTTIYHNLVINVPIYMAGEDKNYGFKIVYPLYSIDKTKDDGD